jgi:hypothetical protein
VFIFLQWYQSKVMVEEEKEKRSLNLLSVISKTIDRQVLGLATTIAWYNYHRSIVFPKDNLFEVTVGGLRYTGDLERLEDCYNKEEKYWKKFSEKEKRFLTVENLLSLSDVPSAVKEFVEKNDTTGGGSFSENSESIGNNCLNSDKEDEDQTLNFGSIGKEDVSWGKQISGKSKGKEVSGKLDVLPVQKFSGPRIRLTARKKVPNQFEKFTFSIPASSGSSSPIHAPDPREKQVQSVFQARVAAQSPLHTRDPHVQEDPARDPRISPLQCDPRLDPVRETRDPRAQARALQTRDPRAQTGPIRSPVLDPRLSYTDLIRGSPQARDPVRVSAQAPFVQGQTRESQPFGPIRPYSNWVWTRNPNLGFSSPSEVRFGPFKRRYDQYSEEYYSGGYPNPHFRYKRFQRGESSQSSRGDQAYPRGNPYNHQGRHYYP